MKQCLRPVFRRQRGFAAWEPISASRGEGLRFSAWSGSLVRRFLPEICAVGRRLCAALAAEGESLVHGAEFVERGYEKIETALSLLGGEIRLTEQG